MKTAFLGTPEIAVPTLKRLHERPDVELCLVVSQPDRPVGRGLKLQTPAVAQFAKDHAIELWQTPNINKDEKLIERLSELNLDFVVVFAFSHFLGKRVLELTKLGYFNIHTSLLPRWRGAAPIQYSLLHGDKQTGITIFKIVKQMDAGPVAGIHTIELPNDWTGGRLHDELMQMAPKCLDQFLEQLKQGQLELTAQDETQVSFAPTLQRASGLLSFVDSDPNQLINQVRALDPWPGTYCFLGPKRLKVFQVGPVDLQLAPGQVSTANQQLCVGCRNGAVRLALVQLEGRKKTADSELINGLKEDIVINPKVS